MKKLKVAFDIGGVLSKYRELVRLYETLQDNECVEVVVISDMHPVQKMIDMLTLNSFKIDPSRLFSADYAKHGEGCKAVLCKELGVDILIDDFIGYVADGDHVRLLVMPNSTKPYYRDEWQTGGIGDDFGRRRAADNAIRDKHA